MFSWTWWNTGGNIQIIKVHFYFYFNVCLSYPRMIAQRIKPDLNKGYCDCLPCFLAGRAMVSLKVLQQELSPPHTPHLSSCFEEPTTPSQPTFCSLAHGKFNTPQSKHMQLSSPHTSHHSPHTPHAHTHCRDPCMSSVSHPALSSAWRPRLLSLWLGSAGGSVC